MSIAEETLNVTDEQSLNGSAGNGSKADLEFLLEALVSLRKGEFTVRLPNDWVGLRGKVADTFNDVMDQLEGMTDEVDRISRVVGIGSARLRHAMRREVVPRDAANGGAVSQAVRHALDLRRGNPEADCKSDQRVAGKRRSQRSL